MNAVGVTVNKPESVPDSVMSVTLRSSSPVFEMDTVCCAELPAETLPKSRVEEDSEMIGAMP